jgi:hypothetical protein
MPMRWDMITAAVHLAMMFLVMMFLLWMLVMLMGCRSWHGEATYPDGSSLDVRIDHFLSNTEIGELDVKTSTGATMSIKQMSTSERLTATLEKVVGILQGALAESEAESGPPTGDGT